MGDMVTVLVSLAAVAWATVGLLVALLVVVPGPSRRAWFASVLVEGYSLGLAVFGLVGLGLAALVFAIGSAGIAVMVGAFALLTVGLGVVPVERARRLAATRGVRLSGRAYLSRPTWVATGGPATVTFACPSDTPGGLQLDIWHPRHGDARSAGRPAVVLVHGGGWVSGARGGVARWNEWLADGGYVVFDIDYRLAPPPRWRDAVDDVATAVGWVQDHAEEHGTDQARVALLGFSAGGHLALLAAYRGGHSAEPSHGPDRPPVAAVAALYPITDLATASRPRWPRWPSAAAEAQVGQFLGGSAADAPMQAGVASPLSHVVDGLPPTLLVHGRRDQMVPVEQSRRLDAALASVAGHHDYLELPGANHAFDLAWGAGNTQLARAVLGGFLARHLAEGTT